MQKNRFIFFLIIAVAVLPLFVFSFLKNDEVSEVLSFPAKIIGIEEADSNLFEISFSVTMNNKTETLYYSRELGRFASEADIKNFDLKIGNVFTYKQHLLPSGNDEPEFFVLTLEKYNAK